MNDQISTTPSALALRAIEVAKKYIGEKEDPIGSNWGPFVKQTLATVGIDFPASWCMALVYRCFKEAADEIGTITPLIKTGGVLRAWNEAASHRVTIPQPGDIIIFDHGHGLGHTGIVTEVNGNDLKTVEGNTNNNGSREGFEVEEKTRHLSDHTLKGFLRY